MLECSVRVKVLAQDLCMNPRVRVWVTQAYFFWISSCSCKILIKRIALINSLIFTKKNINKLLPSSSNNLNIWENIIFNDQLYHCFVHSIYKTNGNVRILTWALILDEIKLKSLFEGVLVDVVLDSYSEKILKKHHNLYFTILFHLTITSFGTLCYTLWNFVSYVFRYNIFRILFMQVVVFLFHINHKIGYLDL